MNYLRAEQAVRDDYADVGQFAVEQPCEQVARFDGLGEGVACDLYLRCPQGGSGALQ
jgi:hypothetical protein